jgi:acetyl-CoA synthetase
MTAETDANRPSLVGEVVWRPTDEVVRRSRLSAFMRQEGVADLARLMSRAASDPEWFWDATVKDLGIVFDAPYESVVDLSGGVEWATWFGGARMNITRSCLDRYIGTARADKVALIWEGENGEVRRLTYEELNDQVCRLASSLTALGVAVGDRIGVFMPLTPEAATAVLSCAKVGAVLVPIFSGYGADAVATRLNDADVSVLICADGFHRRGAAVLMKPIADEALRSCPSVRSVIVQLRLGADVEMVEGRDHRWETLLAEADAVGQTEVLDPEDPLLILYTSGTSGKPKGTVHVHGGFPIKAVQDMAHGFDVQEDDTVFWYTDIGWMMGAWLIYGSLVLGATMVLYDGAPDFPDAERLWQIVERHHVSILGLSPTLVRSLMSQGSDPAGAGAMASLRVIGSTGEMWDVESWMWCFEHAGRGRLPIINYSGGTELSGGILCGNVLSPLSPASFAGPIPGMAADVVDVDGRSLRGAVGELVVRAPNPGMTRGFWKAPERYLDAYWRRFPGVWVHGDWAYIDEDTGLWYVLGRSDDTIKIAGRRIGPGEVESVLGAHPGVVAAAAFGVPHPLKGEGLVCLVIAHAPAQEDLCATLRELVGDALGRPLRPEQVLLVPDLPRTRNGKIVRRAARAAFLEIAAGDISALENPTALDAIADCARLAQKPG